MGNKKTDSAMVAQMTSVIGSPGGNHFARRCLLGKPKKGWLPAFIDVEEGTYNLDANKVEEMITPNTKAMVIPNLMGNLPDWKALRAIADTRVVAHGVRKVAH